MLHTQTVESATLDVLRKLMSIPELSEFSLAGGTALSLYYGHRISVDLDLFSTTDFDNETLAELVSSHFPQYQYRSTLNPIGLFGFIDHIKVDFVKYHHHPLIQPLLLIEGIRLFSVEDIIAMKINAIMRRAVKKDFWDIAELLEHYTVDQMIKFYQQKYPSQVLLIAIPQAMVYFNDSEDSEDPVSLKGQTWDSVKKSIQQKVNDFLQP